MGHSLWPQFQKLTIRTSDSDMGKSKVNNCIHVLIEFSVKQKITMKETGINIYLIRLEVFSQVADRGNCH